MSQRYRRFRPPRGGTTLKNSGHNDPNNVWGSGLNQQGWQNAWTEAAKPKPKPATPAPAPASPAADAQPFDPVYNDEVGLNQADLQSSLAQIEYGRGQVAQEYGFDASGQMDMSNPNNRAALLQRTFQQGQRGTLNSMAGSGQLYSGATQRGLDEGTFRYQRDFDTVRRGAQGQYFDLANREQSARSDTSRSDLNAERDRLERAKEIRPEDPGVPSTPAAAKPRYPSYKRKKKKGVMGSGLNRSDWNKRWQDAAGVR